MLASRDKAYPQCNIRSLVLQSLDLVLVTKEICEIWIKYEAFSPQKISCDIWYIRFPVRDHLCYIWRQQMKIGMLLYTCYARVSVIYCFKAQLVLCSLLGKHYCATQAVALPKHFIDWHKQCRLTFLWQPSLHRKAIRRAEYEVTTQSHSDWMF